MRGMIGIIGAAVLAFAVGRIAWAEMWVDYAPSKEVWEVTQVRVPPSKVDDYLKNLRRGFVPAEEVAKKNGTLLDYRILVNSHPGAAGATILIMEQYANWNALAPDKERDLNQRAELRKTVPKSEADKLTDERDAYRTFVDAATYWGVQYGK
ncbi:hypothetical protein [Burkholderia sp. IT-111MI5]|uniref:hypothetical protein n=1 Tax=Burkholderia sp. IT-111MI5 TaxID=3026439 RepID=UPI0039E08583